MMVKPADWYLLCHSRNCGIVFRQLIQPYVQNSIRTTRPFNSTRVSGLLLIQLSPENSGANFAGLIAAPSRGQVIHAAKNSMIEMAPTHLAMTANCAKMRVPRFTKV